MNLIICVLLNHTICLCFDNSRIDGYHELETENGILKLGFEFMGCYWHFCPHNCKNSRNDRFKPEEIVAEQRRLAKIRNELDHLEVRYECEWMQEKKRIDDFDSKLSTFIGRSKPIYGEDIIKAIVDDQFYGIAKVDVETPEHVRLELEHLNFPFVLDENFFLN